VTGSCEHSNKPLGNILAWWLPQKKIKIKNKKRNKKKSVALQL
jgi:hypothetical protein